MYKIVISILVVSALAGAFFVGRGCQRGQRSIKPSSVEVSIDTVVYSNVEPAAVVVAADSIPVFYFRDTVDGRWSAEVSGHDVELRSLVLLDQHTHTTTTKYSPPQWEVKLQSGIDPHRQWAGVGVERNIGRLNLSLGVGYDFVSQGATFDAQVGFAIWRSK